MQRVHFIAIDEKASLQTAIAISKKNNYQVTCSANQLNDSLVNQLKNHHFLPEKSGWHPERIHKNLNAVVTGKNIGSDNPEYIRAKELGLKIYSVPEFCFHQMRSKTRVVITGTHGKTTTAEMILFVLKQMKMDADYILNDPTGEIPDAVRFTYDSRIAVIVGNPQNTSLYDEKAEFLHYHPHIGVVTDTTPDDNNNPFDCKECMRRFKLFVEQMEVQGRLICYDPDLSLSKMATSLRRDIVTFSYNTHEHEIVDEKIYLPTRNGKVVVTFGDEQNLRNVNAARLACRQIGVTDERFYTIIQAFNTSETS